jgi:phage-related protein
VSGSIDIPVVSKFDPTGIKQAQSALGGFQSSLGKIAGALAAAFSVRAITNFAKEAVLAAEGVATANARIAQIAKTTDLFGASTQAVTDRLIGFAEANEMRLAVDAEVIKSVQGQLLTFKALGATATETGGIFDRTTEAAFNMAAAGFGSAESNAIQLGKALEDPIRGLTALRRSGTTFTAEQEDLIKTLVRTGDLAGAQELILGELESQYGGVAEATANASDRIGLAFDNIKETVGAVLLPVFAELAQQLVPMTEAIGTELAAAFEDLTPVLMEIVAALPGLMQAFMPLIPVIGEVVRIFFELIESLLPVFIELLDMILPAVSELAPIIADALVLAFDALVPVLMELIEAFMPIVEALLPVLSKLIVALAPVIVKLIEAFMPLIDLILPLLVNLIEFLTPLLIVVADILAVLLTQAVGYVVTAFQNFIKFLGPFTKAFEDTFGGVKEFFYGIVNGLIGLWEAFANSVINGVNFVIRALNRVQVRAPQWLTNLTGISSFGINIQELPNISLPRVALADGGIVPGPMNALIGEAGPEAVIPLDKLPMGSTYNITVNAGIGTNPTQVGQEIVSLIKRYERSSGPVFASA